MEKSEPREVYLLIDKNNSFCDSIDTSIKDSENSKEFYTMHLPSIAPYRTVHYVSTGQLAELEAVRVAAEKAVERLRTNHDMCLFQGFDYNQPDIVKTRELADELESMLAACSNEKKE